MQDNTSVDVGELDNGLPFPHHVLSNMSEVNFVFHKIEDRYDRQPEKTFLLFESMDC